MKILSIEKAGLHELIIWYEDDVNYVSASVFDDDRVEIDVSVPIAKYRAGEYFGSKLTSYEVFAATMGKFNPYTSFIDDPIEVDKLDFEELLNLWFDLEKKDRKALKELGSPE